MSIKPMAPYGRAPLPGIKVPPFRSREDAEAYRRQLALYAGALARGRPPGLAEYALCATINAMAIADENGALTAAALRLSLAVAFPVAWTPKALFTAIRVAGGDDTRFWEARQDRLTLWGDPTTEFSRARGGRWTVLISERGNERIDAELASDEDCVLFLGENAVSHHAYPFYSSVRSTYDVDALVGAADSARTSFDTHTRLPLLSGWLDSEVSPGRGRGAS